MKTGWYGDNNGIYTYMNVKPLPNNDEQSLYIGAQPVGGGRYNIIFGIFPSKINTMFELFLENAWYRPTSTNIRPSFTTLLVALQGLKEVEQEVKTQAHGKRRIIYIDGLDERRLKTYTAVLNRYNCGYKTSSAKSGYIKNQKILYKVL